MACGHCRRPRAEILALDFDQLCWTQGLSSSPKSQGVPKVVLRGSNTAAGIASWDPENSPGRPEPHPGRALALPAPRKAPGTVRAAANCAPLAAAPVAQVPPFHGQPRPPQALEKRSSTSLILPEVLFLQHPTRLDGVGGYEMACGHCRRPRKEILASNFDQLCWVRGLSSSPKSQGGSKVMLRGSKMAPEITSWDAKNSLGRPEAHPGPPLALPAPRKAPGSVRAAADCTSPGGHPSDPTPGSACQPSPPLTRFSYLVNYYL